MAGFRKELGPTGRRVADAIRRIRRGDKQDITTAELSRRLTALGQPIPDTSITKTEQGTRRVDVDDLVALAAALGTTPNTLLLPQVGYLGTSEHHQLTPAADGTAERLWQWAQGERPLLIPVPGADGWLGDGKYPSLEFSMRNRPYLTAVHAPEVGRPPAGANPDPVLRNVADAVLAALGKGVPGADVRRVVELSIALPVTMKDTLKEER